MVSCLRPDLAEFAAYSTHPASAAQAPVLVDILDTNECPEDLPPGLKAELAQLAQEKIFSNRYPVGDPARLRLEIAQYVLESGALPPASLGAGHISVGNGSDELIRSLLIATCSGRAGSVLVASPTFSMYGILAQTLGIPVVTVPRCPETWAMDVTAATEAIAAHQATAPVRIVFMVHPNSPTANPLTAAEMAWLQGLSPDILVVVDEAYFEFSQQTTVAEVLTRPNWVVTRTFSKAFRLAAHRVGYSIASPAITQVLEKIRLPYNLPSLSQAAAHLALAHRETLLAIVPEIVAQRQTLWEALRPWPQVRIWPSAANFLYLQPTQGEAAQVQERLYQLGTQVRHTGGGLRVTIGTAAENQRTLAHLKAVL